MDTDPFDVYDWERDWAEEAYWRDRCPECDSKHARTEPCDSELDDDRRLWTGQPMTYTIVPEPTDRKPMSRKELVASGIVITLIFLVVLACLGTGLLPATT